VRCIGQLEDDCSKLQKAGGRRCVCCTGQLEGDFKTTEGRSKDNEQDCPYPMGAKISKGLTSVRCESDFIIFNP